MVKTDETTKEMKSRLWTLVLMCRHVALKARQLGRGKKAIDHETLQAAENHLSEASVLLDSGTQNTFLPLRPASPAGVMELTQIMLHTEGSALSDPTKRPSGSAPSEKHQLVLHAQGGLVPTPDYVAFLSQAQRSGVLQVFTEKEVFWIEIDDGDIVHAHSDFAPAGQRLGDILVEQGVLTQVALLELLDGNKGQRLGARSVEEKRVTRDELLRALETQIRRLFHRLFSSMPREFLFWAGPCLLAEQKLRLNANMLLLDSARAADEALRDLTK
ncbi:MAG TPA: DUF4388 domain-containing protein [Planctomycetota bacterium]|nr:DUF4388 domain-containing protein [Planctomycetota bacterium]